MSAQQDKGYGRCPAPGTVVEVRGERWLVREVRPGINGGWGIGCIGTSGIVKGFEAVFMNGLDTIREVRAEDTVLVRDESAGFSRSKLFMESLLRRTPPIDDRMHLGHLGAFDHLPYQEKPTELALKALRPSILIADGVGIGKTVEAGMLLTELIKRGRGERVLVLALRSVLEQFQREFWTRFSIPLVRLDSDYISRLKTKIPSSKNPFHVFNRCIVSVDTLKNDGRYQTYLEQCNWDVVIIDECHKLASDSSMRGRLADRLAARTDSMILTSATPHNGKPESFARLMNMLDPTAIADEKDYSKEDIEGLFVRRFKKDIRDGGGFQERSMASDAIPASSSETEVLRTIQKLRFQTLDKRSKGRDIFFRYTLMKAFLSSPEACKETIDNRLAKLLAAADGDQENASRLKKDIDALESLERLVGPLCEAMTTKSAHLVEHLRELGVGPRSARRVLVFAERRRTLEALQVHVTKELRLSDDQVQVFHAGMGDQEQMDAIDAFGREDAKVRVLLAGDVASEGVNLHYFCNHLVHYDIPWSPIVLEQRNGRIDRYGQAQTPFIKYLLTKTDEPGVDSDLRIYAKLIEKEEFIYKNLGDPAALMGLYDPEAEAEAIQAALPINVDVPFSVETEEPFDFLALFDVEAQVNPETRPEPALTLFANDLDFFRKSLEASGLAGKETAEFDEDFVAFTPPAELQKVLSSRLPVEALPLGGEYRLTTDRKAMMAAISKARRVGAKDDANRSWPQLQLLWELHPIFQWTIDRTLTEFSHNEASVLSIPHLGSDAAYLFQSVFANKRGQVGLTNWFVIEKKDGQWSARDWRELLASTGFDKEVANRNLPVDLPRLQSDIKDAVAEAERHSARLRKERSDINRPRIEAATQRIEDWRKRSLSRISAYETKLRRAGTVTRSALEKIGREKRVVQERFTEHRAFVTRTLELEDRPSLRLVAVFTEAK